MARRVHQLRCDNTKVLFALRNYCYHDKLVMHLLRPLTFAAAHFSLNWQAIHISGKSNHVTDALSGNNLLTACSFYQPLLSAPNQVSVQLLALLQPSDIGCISPNRSSRLFDSSRPD